MSVSFNEVAGRMLEAGKLKNISALARELEVTPQALSNYKKRGTMPTDLIVRFALIHGVSIDWLISGIQRETAQVQPVSDLASMANLTPDEIVAVGKTVAILRTERPVATAFKTAMDAFYDQSKFEEVLCQWQ